MFGLASVGGPLIGGWFADGPGWRWVFLINLPVGIAALVATSMGLRLPTAQRQHRIDLAGGVLIVAAVTAALLYLNWAGTEYGWTEPGSLALVAAAAVLAVAFVVVERQAAEPIIPMSLFGNQVFSIASVFGFLSGAAMFAGIVFLPLFLQAVMGMSATRAGLAMLPAMLGLVATSMASGVLISKKGRYKVFPAAGSVLLIAAMALLSLLSVDTPYWQVAVYALLFGAGVGLTMQPIITAVQNSVEMRDIGAATSAVNFLQRMGSVIGVAVLGSVLTTRLADHLGGSGTGGPAPGPGAANDIAAIDALPEPQRGQVLEAFAQALADVFRVSLPLVLMAFVVALFLNEMPPRAMPQQVGPATGGEKPAEA